MLGGPSGSGTLSPATPNDPDDMSSQFEVVTSDGVYFRVDDYVLYWARRVVASLPFLAQFRNARTIATDKEIEFTDERIETAEVFQLFVTLATSLDSLFEIHSITPLITNLLLFLRKWECVALYASVVRMLYSTFRNDVTFHRVFPLELFQLGAILDDVAICKVAIEEHGRALGRGFDRWWDGNVAKTPFDPKGWTASFWRENQIPKDYLHALMCSWHTKLLENRSLAYRFETELKALRHPNVGPAEANKKRGRC